MNSVFSAAGRVACQAAVSSASGMSIVPTPVEIEFSKVDKVVE